MGSGRLRLELGQLLVDQAQVDDVVAELTVQQLELLAGHQDGRGAAARAGHHGRLLPRRGRTGPPPGGRAARGRAGCRLAAGGPAAAEQAGWTTRLAKPRWLTGSA